ncbi:MAG TPA: hypothetical protein VFV40_11160 [Nocardioides sp.]|nr:hypothetical protein [Nocardioides sp.]
MNSKITLRAAALGVAALAIGATGIAAGDEPGTTRAAETRPVVQRAENPVTIEHERGIVIEGTALLDGEPVGISLYENRDYGNELQVFFPETDEVGALAQENPFVIDGRVDVTVDVDGREVQVVGVVTETGTTRVVEPNQDAGEQRVVKGTHTVLDADLDLIAGGDRVTLETTGFAFDLDVRHVRLYGN